MRSLPSKMNVSASPAAVQLFLRVLQARRGIAAVFVVLAAAGLYGAMHIADDTAIEKSAGGAGATAIDVAPEVEA